MKNPKWFISLLVIGFLMPAAWSSAQSIKKDDVIGVWLNQDKDAKVEITTREGKYYGKIVWIKDPIDPETNKPKVDKHNPDVSLRNRPTLGLEILRGFSFNGKDEWKDGKIYDPKSGKTYDCYMRFDAKDKLKIRGFIGVSMLGRTTYWTRSSL